MVRFLGFLLRLSSVAIGLAALKVLCDAKICPGAGDDTLVCLAVGCLLVIAWEESR